MSRTTELLAVAALAISAWTFVINPLVGMIMSTGLHH